MELSLGAGWSTFRGGKIGETKVLAFPQVVLLDVTMNNGLRVGASLTINSWEHFGHEVNYHYQRSSLRYAVSPKDPASQQTTRTVNGQGFGIHTFYYNFVAHGTRQDSRVRPFVTAGAGMSEIRIARHFGFNFGGGLKFNLNDRYGFRLDARDYITSKLKDFQITADPGLMHNVEYSAGFSIFF
jgi:outer membrane beta-barrel protein